MAYDKKELDARILRAIEQFDGVPNINALSELSTLPAGRTIQTRISANPAIAEAMEKRGTEYIKGLPEKQLLSFISKGYILPECAQTLVYGRLDAILLREIQNFDGVPNPTALSRLSTLPAAHTIYNRISANPAIAEAMEKRGTEYIKGLPEKQFLSLISKTGFATNLPECAQTLVYGRLDAILLREIQNFDGVPNAIALAESSTFSCAHHAIYNRISANPAIAEAMEKRGTEYIKGLSEKQLISFISKKGHFPNLSVCAQTLIYERLDAILLREIQNFDGVPNPTALSRLSTLPWTHNTIQNRISANPAIAEAMEKRGTEYIKALSEKQLLIFISKPNKMVYLPEYAQNLIYERVDSILLREIQNFDGVPNPKLLSKLVNFPSDVTIGKRIYANPTLWMAYYQKQGHTPDQAVELALERNEESRAAQKALSMRLRDLHAYREMIGIIRCFGDLLVDRIAEVSLYPEPLSKAAKETGVTLEVVHSPLQPFKQGKETDIAKANVVVVQGLHRVAAESATKLFRKVHESLGRSRTVIVTYSPKYDKVEGFLEAAHTNGFELQESGTVFIETPPDVILLSHGVEPSDLGKVRRKLAGESKVLVFRTISAVEAIPIPSLVKMQVSEGTRIVDSDAEPINTPDGIEKVLSAKFFEDSVVLPSAPFIVDVMHARKPVAVIGYDVHPHRKNALETEVKPDAPPKDYRRIARDLAKNIKERQKAGVMPGQISKVPLKRFRD